MGHLGFYFLLLSSFFEVLFILSELRAETALSATMIWDNMACILQLAFLAIFTSSSGLNCLTLIAFSLSWLSIHIHPSIIFIHQLTPCCRGWSQSQHAMRKRQVAVFYRGNTRHEQHIRTPIHTCRQYRGLTISLSLLSSTQGGWTVWYPDNWSIP